MARARQSKRKRSHGPHLIKADYSYYVEQVADLYGVTIETVRRWIRDEGLQRIPNIRPHMVHSSSLRVFQEKRQEDRSKPCGPNQAFCCRCQSPRCPQLGTGTATLIPNRSVRFMGKCCECGSKVVKSIRAAEWNESHPLAVFLSDAAEGHNGEHLTNREC